MSGYISNHPPFKPSRGFVTGFTIEMRFYPSQVAAFAAYPQACVDDVGDDVRAAGRDSGAMVASLAYSSVSTTSSSIRRPLEPDALTADDLPVLAIELRTFTLLVMAGRMQWHRWVETLLACNNSRIRVSGGGIGGGDGDNNSGNGTGTGGTT
ncbi:hypothetical protein ACHAWU_009301 [Discostella pseudostelligera]|uniref:Uncharacterized protein n=1 Tax=Discostella pseudostelligera TaxID=259834 RepID=A0ABD3M357_9STRA